MKNPNSSNSKFIIVLFGAVILICVSVCSLTVFAIHKSQEWSKHDEHGGHDWLHNELGLTKEQADAIDLFEQEYRVQRETLLKEFDRCIEELSDSIRNHDTFSEQINHKIHALHSVHGDLQRLSIEHYYEMLGVLPDEKKERLRALAVEALSKPD